MAASKGKAESAEASADAAVSTLLGSTLADRIARAALQVGGSVHADKKHAQQGYQYLSSGKIAAECGQALSEAGVTVVPSVDRCELERVEHKQGQFRYDASVYMTMRIMDSSESMDSAWAGWGNDYTSPDKAFLKAVTNGHKYFLMKLLNVGVEEEEQQPGRAQQQPAQQARPPVQQPAQQARPPVQQPAQQARPPVQQPAQQARPAGTPAQQVAGGNQQGKPAAQRADPGKLEFMNNLGREVWGSDWGKQLPSHIESASGGRTKLLSHLTSEEVDAIIAALSDGGGGEASGGEYAEGDIPF